MQGDSYATRRPAMGCVFFYLFIFLSFDVALKRVRSGFGYWGLRWSSSGTGSHAHHRLLPLQVKGGS
ncbi:hypothetical protein [Stutzerimonas stutzeri]|uniref:hypothetical protein n=1 Tax=Stutzerimonas stutzeri TaxID=316 RepID=UPI0015E422B5|nr:hypothetical protein [Stutzerimonas stutzeri]MBA1261863.1 hypothetical protein [Stutzerimonas stutzeri]